MDPITIQVFEHIQALQKFEEASGTPVAHAIKSVAKKLNAVQLNFLVAALEHSNPLAFNRADLEESRG